MVSTEFRFYIVLDFNGTYDEWSSSLHMNRWGYSLAWDWAYIAFRYGHLFYAMRVRPNLKPAFCGSFMSLVWGSGLWIFKPIWTLSDCLSQCLNGSRRTPFFLLVSRGHHYGGCKCPLWVVETIIGHGTPLWVVDTIMARENFYILENFQCLRITFWVEDTSAS